MTKELYRIPKSAFAGYHRTKPGSPELANAIGHDYGYTQHVGKDYQEQVLQPFVSELTPHQLLLVDVGTGLGEAATWVEQHRPHSRVLRLDPQPEAFRDSHHPLQAEAYGSHLPLAADSVDGIMCKDVFAHIPDKDQVLHEFLRVLKPGGLALIVTQEVIMSKLYFWSVKRPGQTKSRTIKSPPHYLRLKAELEASSPDIRVNPPYYVTDPQAILKTARTIGFLTISLGFWAPPENEPDWHDKSADRIVMILKKLQFDL